MDISELRKLGRTVWLKMKGDCIFCEIIQSRDGKILFENESVIAFAPLKRGILSKGHMLVVPKKHYEDIFDIPPEVLSEVSKTAKEIAQTLKDAEELNSVNILHASGENAQQSINHFHLHLVPRTEDDLDLWPETDYEEQDYDKNYAKIRKKLEQIT